MRKLGLLIAMFLCVTIGGVYATWSYAGSNDIVDAYAEAKVTITDAIVEGASGIYKIETNLVLKVDDTNNDHVAELIFESNNSEEIYLTVTFTPNASATPEIKRNGVESELYFGTTTPMIYRMGADGNYDANVSDEDATPIFTFANSGDGELNNTITWTKHVEGMEATDEGFADAFATKFTYTLGVDELKAQISLTEDFLLDTKTEHDIFGGLEYNGKKEGLIGNIVARITDGTVN